MVFNGWESAATAISEGLRWKTCPAGATREGHRRLPLAEQTVAPAGRRSKTLPGQPTVRPAGGTMAFNRGISAFFFRNAIAVADPGIHRLHLAGAENQAPAAWSGQELENMVTVDRTVHRPPEIGQGFDRFSVQAF